MNQTELDDILRYAGELWPKWEQTDSEYRLWKKKLQSFNFEACKSGIEAYKASKEGSYNTPKLNEIIGFTSKGKTGLDMTPFLVFTLRCTEHDKNPRMVDKTIEFYGHTHEWENISVDERMASGHRTINGTPYKRGAKHLYGGEWVVDIAGVTEEIPF